MISVGPVEAVWIGLNFLAFVLTLGLLADAYRDRRAVAAANGAIRKTAINGRIVGERFRALINGCLLLVAVPSVFTDRETPLNPQVALLMAVPALMLLWAYLDTRRGKLLLALVARETRR
jgi:hypothetical protein